MASSQVMSQGTGHLVVPTTVPRCPFGNSISNGSPEYGLVTSPVQCPRPSTWQSPKATPSVIAPAELSSPQPSCHHLLCHSHPITQCCSSAVRVSVHPLFWTPGVTMTPHSRAWFRWLCTNSQATLVSLGFSQSCPDLGFQVDTAVPSTERW